MFTCVDQIEIGLFSNNFPGRKFMINEVPK